MSYYFSTILNEKDFEKAIEKVTLELKNEGFGILTEINITQTLKEKLGVDFKKYRILGACNPPFAHEALTHEEKIGLFLPCNVVVLENENGEIEVAAVDPVASMISVKNKELASVAQEIQQKLKNVIDKIS